MELFNSFVSIDIINYVSEFLSVKDVTALKNSSKHLREIVKISTSKFENNLIKLINARTKSSVGEKIVNTIKESKYKLIVGGSTITQCIYNEYLEGSDVDIYVELSEKTFSTLSAMRTSSKGNYHKRLLKELRKHRHIKKLLDTLDATDMITSSNATDDEELNVEENYMIDGLHINYYNKLQEKQKNLTFMRNNDCNPVVIQLIIIPNIKKHLQQVYDFTFSRNYYNGKNVYSIKKNDVMNKCGNMAPWQAIYDKAVYTKGNSKERVTEHMLFRMAKYVKRGYTIKNYAQRLEEIDKAFTERILRNYYEPESKIIGVRISPYNEWLEKQYLNMKGVTMSTRTIEVVFTSKGKTNYLINNKGHPKTPEDLEAYIKELKATKSMWATRTPNFTNESSDEQQPNFVYVENQ